LTFESYTPEEIVAIARHIAGKEKIAIAEQAWPLLEAEAARLRSLPTDSGTALDVAGNGRYEVPPEKWTGGYAACAAALSDCSCDSAPLLSQQIPVASIDRRRPASAHACTIALAVYWADSISGRNTGLVKRV
jgi:hypothetical protein